MVNIINSLRLSDAYMHQQTRPILAHCYSDIWELNFNEMSLIAKIRLFSYKKANVKCCPLNDGHFVLAAMC